MIFRKREKKVNIHYRQKDREQKRAEIRRYHHLRSEERKRSILEEEARKLRDEQEEKERKKEEFKERRRKEKVIQSYSWHELTIE